jgi:CubicO group peptidase (beta-lactamase class C family)
MKKVFFPLLFILLLSARISAQKITSLTTPEAAGFSSERLKLLDKEMNEWAKNEWMQGGVALIIRNGKVAYYKAAGLNDLYTKSAMQKENIFRIASQTKAITSVAMMMLFEEGKFSLDDAVSKYIPAFKKQQVLDKFNPADTTYTTVPAKSEITIRQLFTHTSGLGYAQIGSKEANAIYAKSKITAGIGVQDDNLLDAMNRLAKLPLMHQPAERWTYGLNSDLLGCLVEVISGMTLNDFFRIRIFEPLGMKDTYFYIPSDKTSRLVNLYREDSTGQLVKAEANMLNGPTVANYPLINSTYYSGGAGLSSTIYDYAVFLQMLLNNGTYNGKRLLSRNTIRIMTMNQIGDLAIWGGEKFGLGFQVVTEKTAGKTLAQEGTYSWGGAFSTSYWVDPKEKIVMLFYRQLQSSTHGDVAEKFRSLTYAAIND